MWNKILTRGCGNPGPNRFLGSESRAQGASERGRTCWLTLRAQLQKKWLRWFRVSGVFSP